MFSPFTFSWTRPQEVVKLGFVRKLYKRHRASLRKKEKKEMSVTPDQPVFEQIGPPPNVVPSDDPSPRAMEVIRSLDR